MDHSELVEHVRDDNRAELASEMTDALELFDDAVRALRGVVEQLPELEQQRAKGYWLAAIVTARSDDHDYLGSGSHTMEDNACEKKRRTTVHGPDGRPVGFFYQTAGGFYRAYDFAAGVGSGPYGSPDEAANTLRSLVGEGCSACEAAPGEECVCAGGA